MGYKKIISLVLILVLASGLVIGMGRIITSATLLNANWYHQTQHQIYYVDRLTTQINAQIQYISNLYGVDKSYHELAITKSDIERFVNYRVNNHIALSLNRNDVQLAKTMSQTEAYVEKMIDTYLYYGKTRQSRVSELDGEAFTLYREHIISDVLNSLIERYEPQIQQANRSSYFLYEMMKSKYTLLSMLLIASSIVGLFLIHYKKISTLFACVSLGTLLCGIGIHVYKWSMMTVLNQMKFEFSHLYDEFAYSSFRNLLDLFLFAGKLMIVVSASFIIVAYGLGEYKQIKSNQ